jgi:hypothetical protein
MTTVEFYTKGKKPRVSSKTLAKYFKVFSNEDCFYFTFFSGAAMPVPLYENSSPNQNILVQYSLIKSSITLGLNETLQFFSTPGFDERRTLIEQFLIDTEEPGIIILFNEKQKEMLRSHQDLFPNLFHDIQNRLNRSCIMHKFFEDESAQFKSSLPKFRISQILKVVSPDYYEEYQQAELKTHSEAMRLYMMFSRMNFIKQMEARTQLKGFSYRNALALSKIFESLRILSKKPVDEEVVTQS